MKSLLYYVIYSPLVSFWLIVAATELFEDSHNRVRLVGLSKLSQQKNSVDESHNIGNKTVRVIRIRQQGGTKPNKLPTKGDYLREFSKVTKFYQENSGGKLNLSFEFHNGFETIEGYSKASCQKEECDFDLPYFPELTTVTSQFHFLMIFEDYCPCLKFRGLGQVLRNKLWLNGFPNFGLVAHELGHNFGASHANVGQREYANYFSIMGTGEENLYSHFSIAGKTQFHWLSIAGENQIRVFARSQSCGVLHPSCIDTCTKETPCSFQLSAHDTGAYLQGRVYGVKVLTNDQQESIWLEYRTGFKATRKGVLLTWTYEAGTSPGRIFNYGPTQLVNARVPKKGQDPLEVAAILAGETFVYDLDEIGLVVSVEKVNLVDDLVELSLYFTADLGLKDRYLGNLSRKNEGLSCGLLYETNVRKGITTTLYHFELEGEALLEIFYSLGSSLDDFYEDEHSGLYFYRSYPLQHDLNFDFDASRGAFHFVSFEGVSDLARYESAAGDTFYKEVIDFRSKVSANRKQSTMPSYVDFSAFNYILLYVNSSREAMFKFSLKESPECFTFCDILKISGLGTTIRAKYSYESNSYVDISNNYHVILDADNRWKIVTTAPARILAVQSDEGRVEWAHIVTSWTPEVEVKCLDRLTYSLLSSTALSDLSIEITAVVIIFMAVLASLLALCLEIRNQKEIVRTKRYGDRSGAKRPKEKEFRLSDGLLKIYQGLPRSNSLERGLLAVSRRVKNRVSRASGD